MSKEQWSKIHKQALDRLQPLMQEWMEKTVAEIYSGLQEDMGGSYLYIPSPPRYDEQAVLNDFDGSNLDEVARKHRISPSTLYRILNRRGG
jgi:Mor family transcriptional regulator